MDDTNELPFEVDPFAEDKAEQDEWHRGACLQAAIDSAPSGSTPQDIIAAAKLFYDFVRGGNANG